MLRITIVAIGKIHEPWKSLADEYAKRLSLFAKVDIREVADVRFRSPEDKERVISEEGIAMKDRTPKDSTQFALTEHGKEFDTPAFAKLLSEYESRGEALTFFIGGPLGISDKLVKDATKTFALSKLTFTHEMARVILLEQIYRAMTIVNKKPYHY